MTILQNLLLDSLKELGVEIAGTFENPGRRSVSDLVTDLHPIFLRHWFENRYQAGIEFEVFQKEELKRRGIEHD